MDKPVFQRLDFSEPPPGYGPAYAVGFEDGTFWSVSSEHGPSFRGEEIAEVLAAAWTHYKASNDPPGIVVMWEPDDKHYDPDGDGEWHAYIGSEMDALVGAWSCWWSRCTAADKNGMAITARAAAWSWYERRLALVESHGAVWPDCLTWKDEFCSEIEEGQHPSERVRQMEEHHATELALLDFSGPPPGWVKDPIRAWAHEPDAKHRRRPLDVAWSLYKAEHNPPGMWCGFSRTLNNMDRCQIRVGVTACGNRWELFIEAPEGAYKGWLQMARGWAWAHHDRRHALMLALRESGALTQRGVKPVLFHQLLCWSDSWLEELDAWVQDPSLPAPDFLIRNGGQP